jgi:hypothetical protein
MITAAIPASRRARTTDAILRRLAGPDVVISDTFVRAPAGDVIPGT